MADYSGIYNVVRGKLRKKEIDLPDDDFSMSENAGLVVPMLLQAVKRAGVPSSYEALSSSQKPQFDGAAGRIIAARIRPELLASENEGKGVVVSEELDDIRVKYAASTSRAPGTVGNKPLEEQWLDQANEMIALLCKSTRPANPAGGSFYALPGARRAQTARDGYRPVDVRELLLSMGCVGRRTT